MTNDLKKMTRKCNVAMRESNNNIDHKNAVSILIS